MLSISADPAVVSKPPSEQSKEFSHWYSQYVVVNCFSSAQNTSCHDACQKDLEPKTLRVLVILLGVWRYLKTRFIYLRSLICSKWKSCDHLVFEQRWLQMQTQYIELATDLFSGACLCASDWIPLNDLILSKRVLHVGVYLWNNWFFCSPEWE